MLFITAVVVKEDDKNYIPSTLVGGQPLVFLHICEENKCDIHEFEVASLESINSLESI